VRHGVKSLAEIKDEHIHLLLVIQVSADFYINDIGENIGSSVRLFADDSLVYMAVSYRNDCQRLQDDLATMVNWSKKWQMIFNPSKCYTLRITKGKQPVIYPYHMEGPVLESVNNNPYLD
jgi:hypothetical protein